MVKGLKSIEARVNSIRKKHDSSFFGPSRKPEGQKGTMGLPDNDLTNPVVLNE